MRAGKAWREGLSGRECACDDDGDGGASAILPPAPITAWEEVNEHKLHPCCIETGLKQHLKDLSQELGELPTLQGRAGTYLGSHRSPGGCVCDSPVLSLLHKLW